MGVGDTSIPSSERPELGSVNIPLGEYPATSTNASVDAKGVAEDIVARLNNALEKKDHASVASLFLADNSYWRDHLALSWEFRTVKGRHSIQSYLDASPLRLQNVKADSSGGFRSPNYGPIDAWGDVHGIVFFFTFETTVGRGEGVINLAEESDGWRIFTLYTALKELKGHEEPTGGRRSRGVKHGGDPNRKNWAERREAEKNDIDPRVLVIGAGQGGLTVGARLKMLNVPTLIIDSNERVGDNWRKRYRQLVLHDPVWYDHMPYLPFPPHWPVFTPKDKLAEWFEAYVNILELVVWTSTTLTSTAWDDTAKQWTVTVERRTPSGTETRTLHPKHVVFATGHSGKPNMPAIPGIDSFSGTNLCHSSAHPGANPAHAGKNAIVVGACNSAHDIAQDFYEKGYNVTIVQRSTTCVVSSTSITDIGLAGLYDETAPPTADADLMFWSIPSALLKAQQIKLTRKQADADAALLDGLKRAGFGLDSGPMGAGLLAKYFQRGGGYYIDVGASSLIASGAIRVAHGHGIARVLPQGIQLSDPAGTVLPADEVVFATGYQNMRTAAAEVFGEEVGAKVKDSWGFNDEGEFRTMWQGSGHEGLWFMGGNLALARYYSALLALRIKGVEVGLV
jgi:cation diffusion facilitator CzcD-associated flavoprotein CzcO